MKVLTVWQPWASLIAIGAKPYEFRSHRAPKTLIGQRIAIHAGARPMKSAEVDDLILRLRSPQAWTTCLKPEIALPFLETRRDNGRTSIPHATILCTAILGEPVQAWEIVPDFGGMINDSDRAQHCNWACPLTGIEPVRPFAPHRGAQGWSDWQPSDPLP
jgi:hypothetical protein